MLLSHELAHGNTKVKSVVGTAARTPPAPPIGMVLLGGLNPLAAAEEAGVEAENIAEAGTIDFRQFVSCREL